MTAIRVLCGVTKGKAMSAKISKKNRYSTEYVREVTEIRPNMSELRNTISLFLSHNLCAGERLFVTDLKVEGRHFGEPPFIAGVYLGKEETISGETMVVPATADELLDPMLVEFLAVLSNECGFTVDTMYVP